MLFKAYKKPAVTLITTGVNACKYTSVKNLTNSFLLTTSHGLASIRRINRGNNMLCVIVPLFF